MSDPRLLVQTADITTLTVDAIVNAANSSLLGGGGVDGAIHRAAVPDLLAECRRLGGCLPGEAKVTAGYRLPARWIIHTVGPVWTGAPHDDDMLAGCYRSSLAVARTLPARTIAFPAISTGAYRFPRERAAEIATATVAAEVARDDFFRQVIFCCFDEASAQLHRRALEALRQI